MSSEGTLRVTAARRVSSPARRATRETKPETTVVYILVAKVPVTGRARGRAEERAADSSPQNSGADGSYTGRCRGGIRYIRLRERCRVCVRRIIRRLRSRNNRSEFRVNRFAADTFSLYILYVVYGKFQALAKKIALAQFRRQLQS